MKSGGSNPRVVRLEKLAANPPERKPSFNLPVYPEVPEVSIDLTIKKARFALEQAKSKRKVLVDFTKEKTIKELQSEVEFARSQELSKKANWQLAIGVDEKFDRELLPKTK